MKYSLSIFKPKAALEDSNQKWESGGRIFLFLFFSHPRLHTGSFLGSKDAVISHVSKLAGILVGEREQYQFLLPLFRSCSQFCLGSYPDYKPTFPLPSSNGLLISFRISLSDLFISQNFYILTIKITSPTTMIPQARMKEVVLDHLDTNKV